MKQDKSQRDDSKLNEEEKGVIHNTILSGARPKTEPQEEKKVIDDDESDDWGAVPAFLRRSKIK